MRTARQLHGASGERTAVRHLEALGWRVAARNVRIGPHDEIDIVAVDPGPREELVCVEVRSARSSAFGAPEERVDARKIAHLYRAAHVFSRSAVAQDLRLCGLPVRVDLIIVDMRHRPEIRHLRRVEPA